MKVRGDNAPPNAFTLEEQPKNPGFVLARFFENVAPFEEKKDGLTISGFEYDEYQLELADTGDLLNDVLNRFDYYISAAKLMEAESGAGESVTLTPHEAKLLELKTACNAAITGGVDVETAQGTEHFSLTTEDQINIQNLAFQVAAGASGVLYHADGALCRAFTVEEINAITVAAVSHVTYHTTYFNHLKAWVERTDDIDELDSIFYGADLPADLAASMAALLGGGGS